MADLPSPVAHWRQRTAAEIAGVSAELPAGVATVVIVGLLAASWATAYMLGGAGPVPPHWFYILIIVAALRFGWVGTLVTSMASGVLAGPLLPLDVTEGTSQVFSDWGMRTGFFVGIGQVLALLINQPRALRLSALRSARLDRSLRQALVHHELEVHYQPIFDVVGRRHRVVGAEALIRWHHPKRGLILPSDFIPAAEATGVVVELGEFVLHEVCRRISQWSKLSLDHRFTVSMNLSARELTDPQLLARVDTAINSHGIDPERLAFEVTETAVIEDMEVCLRQLTVLRERGVRLAIDDFGTGQSSLSYVNVFPVHTIKLDRSFTARMTENEQGQAIVGTVVLLAHTLDLTAVAEGVETPEQLELLKAMRCDYVQGFHLGMPSTPERITIALEAQEAQRRRQRSRSTDHLLSRDP
ncbi:MAG: putative bifunctional diguanylate cyclase/phosphodiesterase [Acidimicrobiia bacterium]